MQRLVACTPAESSRSTTPRRVAGPKRGRSVEAVGRLHGDKDGALRGRDWSSQHGVRLSEHGDHSSAPATPSVRCQPQSLGKASRGALTHPIHVADNLLARQCPAVLNGHGCCCRRAAGVAHPQRPWARACGPFAMGDVRRVGAS